MNKKIIFAVLLLFLAAAFYANPVVVGDKSLLMKTKYLHLEISLLKNIYLAEEVMPYIDANDYNSAEEVLINMRALYDSLVNYDLSDNNNYKDIFINLKTARKFGKHYVKQFREFTKKLSADDKEAILKAYKEKDKSELDALKQEFKDTVRRYNLSVLEVLSNKLNLNFENIKNMYLSGDIGFVELKNALLKRLRHMKKERLKKLREIIKKRRMISEEKDLNLDDKEKEIEEHLRSRIESDSQKRTFRKRLRQNILRILKNKKHLNKKLLEHFMKEGDFNEMHNTEEDGTKSFNGGGTDDTKSFSSNDGTTESIEDKNIESEINDNNTITENSEENNAPYEGEKYTSTTSEDIEDSNTMYNDSGSASSSSKNSESSSTASNSTEESSSKTEQSSGTSSQEGDDKE